MSGRFTISPGPRSWTTVADARPGPREARPCSCESCSAAVVLLTGVGRHGYSLERDADDRAWRWVCTCGGRGRWQEQSDNAAFHAWRRHAGLEALTSTETAPEPVAEPETPERLPVDREPGVYLSPAAAAGAEARRVLTATVVETCKTCGDEVPEREPRRGFRFCWDGHAN